MFDALAELKGFIGEENSFHLLRLSDAFSKWCVPSLARLHEH